MSTNLKYVNETGPVFEFIIGLNNDPHTRDYVWVYYESISAYVREYLNLEERPVVYLPCKFRKKIVILK